MTLSRRTFVGGLLAAAACSPGRGGGARSDPTRTAPTAGADAPAADLAVVDVDLPEDPFTLGVASGDPDERSVVLWTRLVGGGSDRVALDVATDEAFTDVVRSSVVPVDTERGHCVHAVVDGLAAGRTYWYRFRAGAFTSPTGRTRTAPDPSVPGPAPVRLAVASCQRRSDGAWAAHHDIAAAAVDLVVFLGDYVYAEATTLEEYRRHYEEARADPALAAAHAAHPWAVTWDDHEVANDHAGPAVPAERRQAAYQAWWEHQPVRLPPPTGGALAVHRRLRWGSVDVLLLDTRQHRSEPRCGGGVVERSACPGLAATDRTMLGAEQEAWLAATVDPGRAWTVVAQSVVLTPVEVLGRVNVDAWDGCPAARDRLLATLPADRSLVLTGDVHIQMVGDAAPGVTELVCSSISSRPAEPYASAAPLLPAVAAPVRHAADRRGWLRVELAPGSWRATYREVVDPGDAASAVVDGPSFAGPT